MTQPGEWDRGSILIFFIIVVMILFGPLFMGPVTPPEIPLLMVFVVALTAIWILLILNY